ncbi:MAG: molybdopterin molybdotransferase MoeA [Croceibacterium sp.]
MSLPPPLPLSEAWARLLDAAEPLGAEEVPAEQAVGRYLAGDLHARRTQPAADLSAMDGYAIRAGDERGPWTVVGDSAAGHPYPHEPAPGEAVRLSTGALMPPGTALVLVQENASRAGASLSLNGAGAPSPAHIRRTGFDFRAGDVVLPAGIRIGAGQLAAAISAGHGVLTVGRLPRVAILDSGDELASDPAMCLAHQIPASNGAMLAAMCAPLAASVTRIGPVADEPAALASALGQAREADVLVTSGGVSVGDHDLVRPALETWSATIDFWRVAIKPGKPLLVARRGEQWILGLPGNPVSSYVTAFLFVLPLLRRLAGASRESALSAALTAPLAGALPATGNRREFVRAQLDPGGSLVPLGQQDSSALATLAVANALIDRATGSPAAAPGDTASFYWLPNGGIA